MKNNLFMDLFIIELFHNKTEYEMDNWYINELIDKLKWTEIWQENREKSSSYNEGMELLVNRFIVHKEKQTQLFFLGNGGSSAIASHMTGDFMKNGHMKTCSLYDNAVMTCMGNDYGYENVFSNQLEFLVGKDDLVVVISSSGNSPNIINAIRTAKKRWAEVITFTGFRSDNKVRQMGDINVYVPCDQYGIVESIHNLMLQQIVDLIMEKDKVKL